MPYRYYNAYNVPHFAGKWARPENTATAGHLNYQALQLLPRFVGSLEIVADILVAGEHELPDNKVPLASQEEVELGPGFWMVMRPLWFSTRWWTGW